MGKHTPTPWSVDATRLGIMAGYQSIAQAFRDKNKTIADREAEAQANAAFIVRACNAHEQLASALLDCLSYVEEGWLKERVRAALRAAGVEP